MNGKVPWCLTFVFSFIITSVFSQCFDGNVGDCVWTHDENAPLRWIAKKNATERWVEVSGCGSAVLQTPWLPPTEKETSWMLRYKIYGFNTVKLELSLRTEDSGPRQIFFKVGNYAHGKPEYWTANKIALSPIPTKHMLRLEAVTPYEDAFVAVSNIRTEVELTSSTLPDESAPRTAVFRTTTVTPARPTDQEPIEPETRTVESTSLKHEVPLTPDTQTDSDDENEVSQSEDSDDENEVSQSEDRLGTLGASFYRGNPDLRRGYTIVKDPNICRYP